MVITNIPKINMILTVLIGMSKHKDTDEKYDPNGFDIDGNYQYNNDKYNFEGFDRNDKHKDTNGKYDPNGFNIDGNYQYNNDKYNFEGFDRNCKHKDSGIIYDPNDFDIDGIHRYTDTFFDEKNDENYRIKLYDEIIKKGKFTGTVNKKVISSKVLKDFAEDILIGNIKNNNAEEKYKEKIRNVEKDLSKSKKKK